MKLKKKADAVSRHNLFYYSNRNQRTIFSKSFLYHYIFTHFLYFSEHRNDGNNKERCRVWMPNNKIQFFSDCFKKRHLLITSCFSLSPLTLCLCQTRSSRELCLSPDFVSAEVWRNAFELFKSCSKKIDIEKKQVLKKSVPGNRKILFFRLKFVFSGLTGFFGEVIESLNWFFLTKL